jgi:glycosyltransferase involved in cell wall biosynthesis
MVAARGKIEPVDRLIAHWAVPCAWPIAARARAPLEVVSHGGDVRMLCALPRGDRLVRAIAARADLWRFPSRELLAQLTHRLDDRAAREVERVARVVAPPIDLPDVRAAALALRRMHRGKPLFVSVGRLVPGKCVQLAIDHARSTGARLIVVGDGPERSRLERRARGADVRFVGALPREQALAWIGAADALLFASRAEGLPTVVREAEALGVRVERL